MLKKNIQDQELIQLLKEHYDIDIHKLQVIHGGADMNAMGYKAESKFHSYFIKLKYNNHDEMNLSIIRLLYDAGIKEMIFPIKTLDATLFQQVGNFQCIVYPFINAENGFTQNLSENQWKQLGKALRQIHETAVPASIKHQLRKEEYSPEWRKLVRSFYNKMEMNNSDDAITANFKSCFYQNAATIRQLVDTAEKLAKNFQPDLDKYVLCHSDIHAGNVLVLEDSIYIIDWDEPMLAPKERDLMFIGGGVGNVWNTLYEIQHFYEGYGNVTVDKIMLSYYRHERIVQDIAEYSQYFLSSDKKDESSFENFRQFKAMFEPNNVVEIASCQ